MTSKWFFWGFSVKQLEGDEETDGASQMETSDAGFFFVLSGG
jgi:hypothetical protein